MGYIGFISNPAYVYYATTQSSRTLSSTDNLIIIFQMEIYDVSQYGTNVSKQTHTFYLTS